MRTRLAALPPLLPLLQVLVQVAPAAATPYAWTYAKIIRMVEGPGDSGEKANYPYQLIANLPFVKETTSQADEADLRPQPEQCDHCAPGSTSQPADAGRVNSLVHLEGSGRALPNQFPWHVSLLFMEKAAVHCSGSLLSAEWVLTAANCVAGFPYVRVRLGSYRPGAEHERFREVHNATHFVVHPGYRKGSPRDDIAVIKLPKAVKQLNSFVLPVRLPSLNSFLTTYAGREALLSSWGAGFAAKPGTFGNRTLGFLAETVLPNEQCAKSFGRHVSWPTLCTTTTHFTDGSLGDSGAPLVVQQDGGSFVQVGILTFASSVGFSGGHPAGYTRVTSYLWWIQNATGLVPGPDV